LFAGNPFFTGLRELLNLTPLMILPVLYEKFQRPDSKAEHLLFALILAGGVIIIFRDILTARSRFLDSLYLWQVGRANSDDTLSGFFVLVGVSMMMSLRRRLFFILSLIMVLFAAAGVAVSFSRGLYVATIIA